MNFKSIKKSIKKSIAGILVGTLVFSSIGMDKLSVRAANTKTYISDIKMITGELTKEVKEKYKGYKFIEKSLSEGGGGTKIYMAYKTTTNSKDAIRDIAFMQMKGNYSASAYEKVLEENMELATQNIEEFKCVVEEFRANYNSSNLEKKKLADQAYELLNEYYEEDTGLGMGDFFLNKEDKVTNDNYVTLAMQAPSATLSTLISIISKAVDLDQNSTWLDRLVAYNGFDGLCVEKFGHAPANESERNDMSNKFGDIHGNIIQHLTAQVEDPKTEETTCAWDEFAKGLKKYSDSLETALKEYDPEEMEDADTVEEFAEEAEETTENQNAVIFGTIYETLSNIKYGDGTLADLFMKTSEEMTKEDFYPILNSLSEAQKVVAERCGFSALFSNSGEQVGSKAVNEENSILKSDDEAIKEETGKTVEQIQEESVNNQIETIEDTIEDIKDNMPYEFVSDMIIDDKISVYAGVDREFFKSGVAMTTSAQDKDSEGNAQSKKSLPIVCYITGAIGVTSIVAGISVFALSSSLGQSAAQAKFASEFAGLSASRGTFCQQVLYGNLTPAQDAVLEDTIFAVNTQDLAIDVRATEAATKYATTYRIIGTAFMVVGLALTAYAIVEAVMTLIKKDDPKYTEIPMRMVDSSNGEKKDMEDFLYYNAVSNDSGVAQDLNDWTSGMWLAMYTTKTKDAGEPILADSIKIQKDSNNTVGMESAHLFGETGAYNMLTYSKNKKSQPKLFMYFEKDESSKNTGSVFGINTILASVALVVIGCAAILFRIIYKKKDRCVE